jgi:C-terminal processing protease CtpA/Prc
MKKRYLIASLLIHLSFVLFLALHGGEDSASGGRPAGNGAQAGSAYKHDDIRPKVVEVEMREAPHEKDSQVPAQKEASRALRECEGDKWYGGIGVEENFFEDLVIKVYPGYPAAEAGIQAGDKIITVNGMPTNINDVRGTPGTTAIVTVDRGGQFLTFSIVRDKICTEH